MKNLSGNEPCRRWTVRVRENKVIVMLIVCIAMAMLVGVILIFALPRHFAEKERHLRLPSNLLPTHYSLEIKPYLIPNNPKFEGKVKIKITCKEDTYEVVLHSVGLEIDEEKVEVQNSKRERLGVLRIRENKENQFLVVQFSEELKQNETYHVSIDFRGTMNGNGVGFYVSSHEDANGITRYTASTHFALKHARRAFPCFDEPAMKATFDITVVRWKNMTSLSNMNREKMEPRGADWVADIFQTTPKMSTYLVAFVVGDYEGSTKQKISVWSSPDEANYTDFILDTSLRLLEFYNGHLPQYVLPKLDMVPVARLSTKAIGNWGLVIFSGQSYLLYGEHESGNTIVKQRLSSAIARGIAHQWFGNLVTPKRWSDIWLSEGVATYMEHIASKALFPHWFQIDKTMTVIYEQLIQVDCNEAGRVQEAFNKETIGPSFLHPFIYLKGAAVIRMAHEVLGDRTFWKGLSRYLRKYAYGVAEENNLWECLTKEQQARDIVKLNMTEKMTAWTHLPSLPIIDVVRDYDRQLVTFTQMSCNQKNPKEHKNDLWPVPIIYTTSKVRHWNPSISLWLTSRNTTMKDTSTEKEWILVNGKSTGYYIVNYDRTNWNLLAADLRKHHERFPLESRFKILADANLLETMGHITIDTLLDLALFIAKENKLSMFTAHNLKFASTTWSLVEQNYYYREEWKKYVIYLLENAYKTTPADKFGSDVRAPIMPAHVVPSLLCTANYTPCINRATKDFQDWKTGVQNGTINLENYLRHHYVLYDPFCYGIKYGDNSDWEFIYDLYLKTRRSQLLHPLACSENATLVKRLLRLVFEEDRGDGMFAVYVLSSTTHWAEILIYLDEHFDQIASNDSLFSETLSILHSVGGLAKYEQVLATCKKFLRRLSGSKAEELKEMLDKMEQKLPELERKRDIVESWLGRKPWLKEV